jgi:hypothetical protein
MSKENSDNSPFYWLNMCEGVSERITDLLDADVHRPGEGADIFRKQNSKQPALSWRPHFETCTRNYRKRLNS